MDVRLPDGTVITDVPDGTTKAELDAKLRANGYDLSKLAAPTAPEAAKEYAGFTGSFRNQLKTLLAAPEAASFAMDQTPETREALIKARDSGYKSADFGLAPTEDLSTFGRNVEAAKEMVGGTLGSLVAPLTVGALTVGAGGYGTLGAQYEIENIAAAARQQQAAIDAGQTPEEFSLIKSTGAAAGQTALDVVGGKFFAPLLSRFPLFKNLAIGGKPAEEAVEVMADAAKNGKWDFSGKVARGFGKGVAFEAPQEMAQQALELWQAGVPTDQWKDQLIQAGVGGALLGGPIGGVEAALGSHAATKEKTGEEEGDKTEIADPFAGLPENVKAEAERLQQATGISAEEAVARAQEELNGLGQANQRPAGDVGDVGLEPSVPPIGGQNVNAGVASAATGATGAGLGVPSGAAQQAGSGEAGKPGTLKGGTTSTGLSFAPEQVPYGTSTFDQTTNQAVRSTGENSVIDYSGRKMTILNIGGVKVPFYLSTGLGGKKGVAAGKWYPFFGVGADGWINKTNDAEISNYYGSQELREAAEHLDNTVGDIRQDTTIPRIGATGPHWDALNAGLTPTENGVPNAPAVLRSNIDSVLARLNAARNATTTKAKPAAPGNVSAPELPNIPPAEKPKKAKTAKLPLMEYADAENLEDAQQANDIEFWEGRDKENQAAEQAAPASSTFTLDPSTPKIARTAQAVAAVKAVAGADVSGKDINKAAQRLVNSNGGDPRMTLERVLEGEPTVSKKAKTKVAEEVPFEGAPKTETAAPTVVKGAETEVAPKAEAAPDLFSADVNPQAAPYVRAEAAKETVPPEMTKFPAKREAAPYIKPTPTLEPAKKTKKDKGRVYNVAPAKTPNYPQVMILARLALKDKNITQAEFDLIEKQANEESVPPENLGGAVNALVKINKDNRARGPQGVTAERAREMGDPSYRPLQRAEGETDAAEGMFSPLERLIRVALDSKGRLETLHHEAIHAMRSMGLFKDPEWAALSKRAKDEWIAKYKIKEKYAGDNLTEEEEIEEAVAEAYADYVANKNQGGKTKTLFDRVRNFLKAVVDAVRGAPEDVFRRIEKGEVGRRDRKTAKGEAAQGPTYKGSSTYTRGRDAERAQVENALRKRLDELGLHDVNLKVPDSMTVERGEKGVSLQRSKAGEDAAKANNKITDAIDEWANDDTTADSATEALGESVKGHDPEAYVGGLDAALNYTGPKLLEKLLSALPGSTIIKWGSKYIKKHLHEVRNLVDTMVAERANMLRAAGRISVKYVKFVNAHGQKALSAVMAKARILNVNPTEFADVTEALKNDTVIKHLEGLLATTKSPGLRDVLTAELAERQGHIKEVHKLWGELGKQEGGHELYKEVRQYYKDIYKVLRSRWLENAKSQVKGEDNKKALEASLKAIEDEVQTPDPDYYHGAPRPKIIDQYFPFKRFGRYSLRMEADAAEGTPRYYERFDTVAQRDAKIAEIAKKRGVSPKSKIFKLKIEKDEDSYDAKNVSKTVQSMYDTIDKSQVLGGDLDAAKMELKRQLNEILLSNLPARSVGKSQMRAENVEGYSMDFFRVFNTSAAGYANQLPRIKYAPKIRAALKEASLYAENNYSGEEAEKLQLLVNELEKRAEEAITPPKRGAIATAINRFSYVWLLSSGASAATQLTSLPIRVLPALGSRYGYGKAAAKLALFSNVFKSVGYTVTHEDGSKSYTWPSMDLSPMVTSNPLRKRFFTALQERGVFNDVPTEAITQMGPTPENVKLTGEGALAQVGAATDKTFSVMSAMFTSAEQLTRQVSGMSFVEMAYEAKKAAAAKAGVKFDENKAFNEAVDEAVANTRDTLGDYSEFERPRIMNKDLARFVFQFKNYAVTTTKFFLENSHAMLKGETPEVRAQAMNELAGVLLMGGMFFGVTGMPLYSVVTATIDAVLDNLGDDEDKRKRRGKNPLTADDSDQRFRRDFLPQNFGNITIPGITGDKVSLSAMIESGPISAWTDVNWSRRTQFNNLWFQQGMKGSTWEESTKNAILANLGPGVSLGDNFARAIDDFSNGEITRGLIKLNPAFTKGIFTAYQLGTEGATTTKGDVILKPTDFSDYNLVNSVLGFQSDRLARLQNEKFARTGASVEQEQQKSKLLGRYTDLSSHPGSTPEDFKSLFNKIKDYNQRYPLPHMQIDMDNLTASLAASMQKRQYSLYGSYFTPDQLYYELQSVMSAAPPR